MSSNKIEEYIQGTYVPFFSLLSDHVKSKEIKEKAQISFQNIIALFEKQEPISIYINRQEGPLIDIDYVNSNYLRYNDRTGLVDVNIKQLDIKEYYCPICGEKIETGSPFNFDKIYNTDLNNNPYFKKFIIDNKVVFNYINCKHCIDNITENFRKNGKPLVNTNLLNIYKQIAKYLNFSYDEKNNEDKRVLFPVDRLLFRDKNHQPLYLNLFNLGDLAYSSFYYFIKEYNENNKENVIDEEMFDYHIVRIFTKKSHNIFDENDKRYEIYRLFEKEAGRIAYEIVEENDFLKLQLEDFKFKVDYDKWNKDDVSRVECLKDCENCSKILSFESKEQLYEYVNKRATEETCQAKQFLIKEEEIIETKEEGNDENTMIENKEESIEENREKEEKEQQSTENMINPVFNDDEDEDENEAEDIPYDSIQDISDEVEDSTSQDEVIELSFEVDEADSIEGDSISDDDNQEEDIKEEYDFSDGENIQEFYEKKNEEPPAKIDENLVYDEVKEDTGKFIADALEKNNDVFDDWEDDEESFDNVVKQIVTQENEDVPIENYGELMNTHLKHLIIRYFYPSEDDIRTIANYISTNEKKNIDDISLNDILNQYADFKAEDLYKKVTLIGKEVLNAYPGITFEKLNNYVFELKTSREREKVDREEKERGRTIAAADVVDIDREQDYNIFGTEEVDENMEYLKKSREKQAASDMKRENNNKFHPEIVFHTPDDKSDEIPFIREDSLIDEFNQSVFKPVFDNAMKFAEYKCGKMVVTINRYTNFIPIVDFVDIGIRFVCINTEDSVNRTFTLNPVKTSYSLHFPNSKFRNDYSLNILYSNECKTRPMQVARHIYKLIGYSKLSDKRVVQLNGGKYPLAYTSESNAMIDFEKYHSIFADNGRVRMGQVTIIAFVEQDRQSVMYQRREQARNQIHGYSTNSLKDLLDNSEMYYVASAHYIFNKLWNTRIENGKEITEPYILYRITQYTENMYCVVSDGLPAIVSAILKEHDKNYANQNIPCSIVFEYDMTQLLSPSIRIILTNSTGIFETDNTSVGQTPIATVTSYVISEPRFKQPPTDNRNDNCRVDSRMFTSNENTFKNFLIGKIRPETDVTDRKSILLSLGYVPYPEPRPFNYQVTNYALDELEKSSLFNQMFEIELDKLNSINNQNNYDKVMGDVMINKLMAQYQNNDESVNMVARVLNCVYTIFQSFRK